MKKLLHFIVFVALMTSTLFSCAKRATPATIVPQNVATVVKFDLKSLLAKANYKFAENQMLQKAISDIEDPQQQKFFKSILKNPLSLGIDLMSYLYYFIAADGSQGIVASIKNSKKLYNNLLTIDGSLKESIEINNGVYYITTPMARVAWDNRLLIVHIQNNINSLSDDKSQPVDIKSMLNRKKENSFVSLPDYKKFADSHTDIVSFTSAKNTIEYYTSIMQSLKIVTEGSMLDELLNIYNSTSSNSITTCNFESGKIVTKIETLFEVTGEEEERNNKFKLNQSLKGNLNRYVAAENILLFATDIKGDELIANTEAIGMEHFLKFKLSEPDLDIKTLISYLDGDIIATISGLNLSGDNPFVYSAFATLDNDKTEGATKLLAKLCKQYKATKIGESRYAFKDNLIGIENSILYLTNDSNSYISFGKGGIDNPALDKIKGQPGYIGGNLALLKTPLSAMLMEGAPFYNVANYALNLISTYETMVIDNNNIEFVINFTDTKTNSLAKIFTLMDMLTQELIKRI